MDLSEIKLKIFQKFVNSFKCLYSVIILHGLDALTEFFAKTQIFGFAKFLKCSRQDKNQAHLNISMQVKLMFLIIYSLKI